MLLITMAVMAALFVETIFAQTTEFNYQGSLKDGASAANGNYDFEFALFDAVSGGAQLGSTLSLNSVAVANGVFTVKLDFGSQFPGAKRFLEIRVRLAGQPGITTLAPRQQVDSSPYAVKSINSDTATNAVTAANATNAVNATNAATATNATNATQLGGVAANQYVVTTDPRMTDARPPTAGSTNYIQNQTAGSQATSNFSISGNGIAGGTLSGNIVNATTQYNIGGSRILSNAGLENLFAGENAGQSNTAGNGNSFFGFFAGDLNTTGNSNSFFGRNAGGSNTGGASNSFFGNQAGLSNTTGANNSFFGRVAGASNTVGNSNSFFGNQAGDANTTGTNNSFFGNTAGYANTTGANNTIVGNAANVSIGNLTNATAIGSFALVGASNSLVLGSISGVNGAAANTNVGIGTTAPVWKLHVAGTGIQRAAVRSDINSGFILGLGNTDRWSLATTAPNGNFILFNEINATVAFSVDTNSNAVAIPTLGAAGATALCRNALNQISTCSSSLRYKTNIGRFSPGISFVNQLRPISFDWKDGGMKDVGFGAEDIAKIDPRFVTYNDKGEVEGVKYDRIGVVLVNAVKDQQAQIEAQDVKIKSLETQLEAFKVLVCSQNPSAEVCRLNK
ncbi:MAG: tail fiber domain-containing protein [Acidobacteria bacterium]|nr:tail fiber domain-containing protein [Acidobacteriota bacterium]